MKVFCLLALVSFATAAEKTTSLFDTRNFEQHTSPIQDCNFETLKIICTTNERCASTLNAFLMITQQVLDKNISDFNKNIPGKSRAFYYFSQSDYNNVGWMARSDFIEEAQKKALAASKNLKSDKQILTKAINFYKSILRSMVADSTDILYPVDTIIFRGMNIKLDYKEGRTYMATGFQSFTKDISVTITFMGKTPNSPKSMIQIISGQSYIRGRDMNANKDSYFESEKEFVVAPVAFFKILNIIKVAYSKILKYYDPRNPQSIFSASASDSYVEIYLVEILNPKKVSRVTDCM